MEKAKPNIRRTRSGCWNCKSRRRRCTEDKPSCKWCLERGKQCHYGLRLLWEDEAQAMGIAFGRSGMKDRLARHESKVTTSHYLLPTKRPVARYWLTTTWDDIHLRYEGSHRQQLVSSMEHRPIRSGMLVHSDRVPSMLPPHPSLEDRDKFLFQYFSDICTIQRSLVDSDNPWRSVLLPMCFQSDGLLHIAVAWAAHSLRNRCQGRDMYQYDQIVLAHKCRSLKYLRTMLPERCSDQPVPLAQTRCERDGLLLLTMFHCLLEIATGSLVEWTYHMKGAIRIMKFHTRNCSSLPRRDIFSQEVLELVYTFFIEKDTFLGTTMTVSRIEEGNCLQGLEWSSQVPQMFPFLGSRGRRQVNPCMGLSPELLDIISCISDHARKRRIPGLPYNDPGQIFATLQQRLKVLEYPDKSGSDGLMGLHSTVFIEATWIYLHHAIQGQPCQSEIIQTVHLPRIFDALEQIHEVHGDLLGFIPYPMWALFVASCVVQEEDRVRILDLFTVLKDNKPISNVPSTMSAVEAIWKKRDLSPVESSGASSQYATTWTDAISELGWMMPFT